MHKQLSKKISVFQLLLNQIKPSPAVRPSLTEERRNGWEKNWPQDYYFLSTSKLSTYSVSLDFLKMLPRQVKIVSAPRLLALQHIPGHLQLMYPCWHDMQSTPGGQDQAATLSMWHCCSCQLWDGPCVPEEPQSAPPQEDGTPEHSVPPRLQNMFVFPGPAHSAQLRAALTGIQSSAALQPLFSLWNSYYLCVLSDKNTLSTSSASCLSPLFLALVHLHNLTPKSAYSFDHSLH